MRGNRLARGGDPMKTRRERRDERKASLAKTGRVKRLKRRLGRIQKHKFAKQEDAHTTAIMQSYILRRKAERAAEKAAKEKEAAENVSVPGSDADDEATLGSSRGKANGARATSQKRQSSNVSGAAVKRNVPNKNGGAKKSAPPRNPFSASSKRVQTRSLY